MKINLRNQKGFTLIELVVVMVILALLAAVAVPKFLDLQKQAEAASVKKVLGNLRSALSLRVARAIVNSEDLSTLATGAINELQIMEDLLSNKPESYTGVEAANIGIKGIWYDYSVNNDLVYVLKNADIVTDSLEQDGEQKLRYHIIEIQETIDGVLTTVGLELELRRPGSFDWNY